MRTLSRLRTRRTGVALSAVAATSPVAAAVAAQTHQDQSDRHDGQRTHARHRGHHHRRRAFRPAVVSWYGPGFFGGTLACGGTMTPSTMGVASKTLPCGTMVTIRNAGHTVRVPVVDRGPYVGGREFDLTAATKEIGRAHV